MDSGNLHLICQTKTTTNKASSKNNITKQLAQQQKNQEKNEKKTVGKGDSMETKEQIERKMRRPTAKTVLRHIQIKWKNATFDVTALCCECDP